MHRCTSIRSGSSKSCGGWCARPEGRPRGRKRQRCRGGRAAARGGAAAARSSAGASSSAALPLAAPAAADGRTWRVLRSARRALLHSTSLLTHPASPSMDEKCVASRNPACRVLCALLTCAQVRRHHPRHGRQRVRALGTALRRRQEGAAHGPQRLLRRRRRQPQPHAALGTLPRGPGAAEGHWPVSRAREMGEAVRSGTASGGRRAWPHPGEGSAAQRCLTAYVC